MSTVIEAALAFCDRLVVGIGVHPAKTPMFATDERVALIETVCAPLAAAAGSTFEVVGVRQALRSRPLGGSAPA